MRFKYRGLAVVGSLALALGLAACGSSNNSDPYANPQTCFQQLSVQDKAQMQQYAAQNGDTAQTVNTNADGTQDICVLDNTGQEHYYRQQDHFADYLLYSMMFGRSNTLLTYGLVSGQISPSDYLLLHYLVGVGSSGTVYHPYTCSSYNSCRPQRTVVNNVHVTKVYYGNSRKPVSYSTARQHPPTGYAPHSMSSTSRATNKSSGAGRSTSSTRPGNSTAGKGSNSGTHCLMGNFGIRNFKPSGGGSYKPAPRPAPAPRQVPRPAPRPAPSGGHSTSGNC